jgi:hypothetical protein
VDVGARADEEPDLVDGVDQVVMGRRGG